MIQNLYDRKIYQFISKSKVYDTMRLIISGIISKYEIGKFYKKKQLFTHIEIETVNRCNGTCEFCPVNRNSDTRVMTLMSDETFKKIIQDLEQINYRNQVCLFSNNEPFIDNKMPERLRYVKEKLPSCYTLLFSNGTLLNKEILDKAMPYIDRLVIDNYNDDLKLNPTSVMINEMCKENDEWNKKIVISIRKEHEILSSRGGQAPNKKGIKNKNRNACTLPFRTMVVRPTGEISLCCNDALGKITLGNVNDNTLEEIWYGLEYQKVREQLRKGRHKSNIELCVTCDTVSL